MNDSVTIPGAHSRAFHLKQNEQIKIINLEGSQVVGGCCGIDVEYYDNLKPNLR
jgi:hypothetical protein